MMSLPLRERGLKYVARPHPVCARVSLPLRERGLKSAPHWHAPGGDHVAPFTGAWIEINGWQ